MRKFNLILKHCQVTENVLTTKMVVVQNVTDRGY